MGMASSKMYVPSSEKEKKEYYSNADQPDTNIICINFAILKQDPKSLIQIGDPIICEKCGASFNMFSCLKNENQKKIWICEFCQNINELVIEQEEIPNKDDCLYLIEAAKEPSENEKNVPKDISIIFCIDLSGSMGTTQKIDEKIDWKHNSTFSEQELESFKQFMEPWEFQQLKNEIQNSKETYVSRKECILAAIEGQLNEMKLQYPNRRIGVVTFNNEVLILGDGQNPPLTIAGDKLNSFEICFQEGKNAALNMSKPIIHSYDKILDNLNKLKENGQTALGPAISSSLGLASQGLPGSCVVLCTDGIANIGIGSLENNVNNQPADLFFNQLSDVAIQNGITINVVTISGEGCRLDILGTLADKTNGIIKKLKPENLSKDFASVLKGEIIATSVELNVFLHKGLRFRKEAEGEYSNDESVFLKKIGNVTERSELSFEYELKSPKELKESNIDLPKFQKIPFQAKVTYTTKEGKYLRVISRLQEVTDKVDEVEKKASIPILANHAARKMCSLSIKGNYDESLRVSNNYLDFAQNRIASRQVINSLPSKDMLNFQVQSESINNITYNLKKNTKTSVDIPSYHFEKIKEEEEEEKVSPKKSNNNKANVNVMKNNEKNEPYLNADDLDECAAQLFEMKNNQQILPYQKKE